MYELMIVVFVIGYACITIEHQLKVDKAAIALITGILCWTIYVFGKEDIVKLEGIKDYARLGVGYGFTKEKEEQEQANFYDNRR